MDEAEALEKAKADVLKARAWLEKYFSVYRNEEETPSHLLAKRTFHIEYPDVDRAVVCPVFYEQWNPLTGAEYRLMKCYGKLFWKGGPVLRPDIIAYLEVKDARA